MGDHKGYPSIDSLKELSRLFKISIDELISDDDIQNKRLLDEVQSRKYYWCAIACLAVATISAVAYRKDSVIPMSKSFENYHFEMQVISRIAEIRYSVINEVRTVDSSSH